MIFSNPASDRRRRPDSRVQHRRFEARLLQRPAVRHTDDIRQTAVCPEQPGRSRLPLPGSHRRQNAAPVSPLASSEAAGHLQGGSTRCGPQPLRRISVTWYRPTYQLGLFVHPTLCCWSFPGHTLYSLGALFSVAALFIWNSLPADIRLCESVSTFKLHLKTHLFRFT